jgi:hypothetical protein
MIPFRPGYALLRVAARLQYTTAPEIILGNLTPEVKADELII